MGDRGRRLYPATDALYVCQGMTSLVKLHSCVLEIFGGFLKHWQIWKFVVQPVCFTVYIVSEYLMPRTC